MKLVKFKEVNLDDPFFDSLKADYKGFEEWFGRKSDNDAYIQKKNDGSLQAFLYLKIEDEAITDVIPNFPEAKRLKVGTFKIEAHNTKLGERFVRMIMYHALYEKVEEIYVTIFEKIFLLYIQLERTNICCLYILIFIRHCSQILFCIQR